MRLTLSAIFLLCAAIICINGGVYAFAFSQAIDVEQGVALEWGYLAIFCTSLGILAALHFMRFAFARA